MEGQNETKVEISKNRGGNSVSNLKLSFVTFYHSAFLIHHYICIGIGIDIYFNITEEQLKEPMILRVKKYVACYITIWNFSFQASFFCLALTYDVLQWRDKEGSKLGQRIRYIRDVVFNGIIFPLTCFITCMFWGIYFIDRELVLPVVYDQVLPSWLNHAVHSYIMVVLIMETILTSRRYPTDIKVERFMYIFINIFYSVIYYSIYIFGGCWLYNAFALLNWWQLCIAQCLMTFSAYFFYRSAFFFNRLIHGPEDTQETTTKTYGDVEAKIIKQLDGNFKNENRMQITCVENILTVDDPLKDNVVVKNESNGETLSEDSKVNVNGYCDGNGEDRRSIDEKEHGLKI